MLSLTFWHAHASQWCNGVMTSESQFIDSFYYAVQVRIIDKEIRKINLDGRMLIYLKIKHLREIGRASCRERVW